MDSSEKLKKRGGSDPSHYNSERSTLVLCDLILCYLIHGTTDVYDISDHRSPKSGGEILFNGVKIHHSSLQFLRRYVGIVSASLSEYL